MGLTPWIRHTPERAMNRKLRQAGFAARGLDDAAICQVAADDSDGFISEETVEVLAVAHREKNWRRLAGLLVEVGRWEAVDGGWRVHDYEEFNFTKAYWEAHQQQKSEAGKKGARARAAAKAGVSPPAAANGRTPAVAGAATGGSTASLRFASDPVTSSSTHDGRGAGGDDDDQVELALRLLAERDLERREAEKGQVANRPAWLAKAVESRRDRHTGALAGVAGLTAVEIADRLDPPGEQAEDQLARAAAAQRARAELPDCDACDNTGYRGGDPSKGKCPCGRLAPAKAAAK